MLMTIPNRTRGSFIAHPCRSGSGRHDLVDRDAALAVHDFEAVADHSVEFVESGGRVVCPLQPAHDDQADPVLADRPPGVLDVRVLVEPVDLAQPLIDPLAVRRALLLLVPVPARAPSAGRCRSSSARPSGRAASTLPGSPACPGRSPSSSGSPGNRTAGPGRGPGPCRRPAPCTPCRRASARAARTAARPSSASPGSGRPRSRPPGRSARSPRRTSRRPPSPPASPAHPAASPAHRRRVRRRLGTRLPRPAPLPRARAEGPVGDWADGLP